MTLKQAEQLLEYVRSAFRTARALRNEVQENGPVDIENDSTGAAMVSDIEFDLEMAQKLLGGL